MTNETMRKFGYPDSLIREYEHWVVLLRPAQVTLGSLVLAAKSDATAFGALPPPAYAELGQATREIEATLAAEIGFAKINYLMLMMVDPHVHFHVFPRYEGSRESGDLALADAGWPGPPDLKSARALVTTELAHLKKLLSNNWIAGG